MKHHLMIWIANVFHPGIKYSINAMLIMLYEKSELLYVSKTHYSNSFVHFAVFFESGVGPILINCRYCNYSFSLILFFPKS